MIKSILTVAITMCTLSLFAQVKKVDEVNAGMSQGVNRGFKVLVPETTEKEVVKAWEKLMKEYDAKTDRVKKSEDYISPDANIPALGERLINVYTQYQATPEGVYMIIFFDLGGAYLNREMHKEQTLTAKEMIRKFANSTAKESIADKVKEETKKLEKLEKEQKGLVKDNDGYKKDIKNAKETIQEREKDIKENAVAQEKKKKEIAEQKAIAEQIKAKMKKFD